LLRLWTDLILICLCIFIDVCKSLSTETSWYLRFNVLYSRRARVFEMEWVSSGIVVKREARVYQSHRLHIHIILAFPTSAYSAAR